MTAMLTATEPAEPVAVIGGMALSQAAAGQLAERIFSRDYERFSAQQAACGYCSKPVRIVGRAVTVDKATGEILSRYDSNSEPDGVTYVRCGNRRAAVCPSCSHEYKGDMWHLLAAGAGGGMKGVPETVGLHPQVFATFTAPSFGPVHTARKGKGKTAQQCHRPHKDKPWLCPHGKPTWCGKTHAEDDPKLGEPLCPDCYDYTGHVVWQFHSPDLWRAFTTNLRRTLAQHLGVPRSKLGEHAQISFAKVAEFQRRAIVHFHAIIRLDGPATATEPFPAPTVDVDAATLAELVRAAAAKTWVKAAKTHPGDMERRLQFGSQLDVRPVRAGALDGDTELTPQAVAAYIAKYATKACEDFGVPAGITGPEIARRLGVAAHPVRIIETATRIARQAEHGDESYVRLGKWLHMLGFPGHFSSKSKRYSVTLGKLRTARRRWQHAQLSKQPRGQGPVVEVGHDEDLDAEETTLVVGSWSFVGMGWCTQGDAALAAESAALAREYADTKRHARRAAASTPSPSSR